MALLRAQLQAENRRKLARTLSTRLRRTLHTLARQTRARTTHASRSTRAFVRRLVIRTKGAFTARNIETVKGLPVFLVAALREKDEGHALRRCKGGRRCEAADAPIHTRGAVAAPMSAGTNLPDVHQMSSATGPHDKGSGRADGVVDQEEKSVQQPKRNEEDWLQEGAPDDLLCPITLCLLTNPDVCCGWVCVPARRHRTAH